MDNLAYKNYYILVKAWIRILTSLLLEAARRLGGQLLSAGRSQYQNWMPADL